MPIARFEMDDGRVARFEVPEGTTPEKAQEMMQEHFSQPQQEAPQDTGNPILNAVYGAAARGNQAIAGINPWADREKIAAEQEWVKQHPGAGVGSMLADMAITAPAGGAATMPLRALATGGLEALTNSGSTEERIKDAGYSALGSGLGEGVANVIGSIVRPFRRDVSPVVNRLMQVARDINLPLNAAQVTGNKSLQAADSALDNIWASSTAQQQFKDQQRKAWTRAVMEQGGEQADNVAPEVMGEMRGRISGEYQDLSANNMLNVDNQMLDELAGVRQRYSGKIPTNQKEIVDSYLRDFKSIPVNDPLPKGVTAIGNTPIDLNPQIMGAEYQYIRSMLDKQAKAYVNSDPATSEALREIRSSADNAMERGLTPDDAQRWRDANKQWAVMRTVEKAVDPVSGELSPARLAQALKTGDKNRMIYGQGNQELADIARVGKQFLSPKIGDSGTAQRSAMMRMLSGEGLGSIGFGSGALALYNPAAAATAATTALLGGVALPKLAGSMMRNPNGYLANGLTDMTREALPGISRQKVIEELMRNAGVQSTQ